MTAFVEVQRAGGIDVVALEDTRVTVGADDANTIVIDDKLVSGLHAVLEDLGAAWCVRDVGSTNGTFVNGDRISSDRVLRAGDEIRLGRTRLVYRGASSKQPARATETGVPAPDLTKREHDVLVALCRPLLEAAAFSEPAPTKVIAAELVIGDATVKEYLGRLYDKFDLHDGARRRLTLANEAVARGAVTLSDLRPG